MGAERLSEAEVLARLKRHGVRGADKLQVRYNILIYLSIWILFSHTHCAAWLE